MLRKMLRYIEPYLYLLPALGFVSIFFIYPVGQCIWISFCKWNIIDNYGSWRGVKNYVASLQDPIFLKAIYNTFYYTSIAVPFLLVVGLAIALLINKDWRGVGFFRGAYFLPWVIPWVTAGTMWLFLANDQIGIFNYFLQSSGIIKNPLSFFNTRFKAMMTVISVTVWKSAGFSAVILLGGLISISPQISEAAKIDGANRWQIFIYITLPLLKASVAIVLVLTSIGSLLAFDHFWVMTHGAPGYGTETIVMWIYARSFQQFQFGEGAAMSLMLLGIVGVLTFSQLKALGVLRHE